MKLATKIILQFSHPKELDLLYNIGEDLLGYSRKEIAHYFAAAIQEGFTPSHEGLK